MEDCNEGLSVQDVYFAQTYHGVWRKEHMFDGSDRLAGKREKGYTE